MRDIAKDDNGIVHYTGTLRAKLDEKRGIGKDGKEYVLRTYLMHRRVRNRWYFFMFEAFDRDVAEIEQGSEGTIWCNVYPMRSRETGLFHYNVRAFKWEGKPIEEAHDDAQETDNQG